MSAKKPNIVFITIDALRADHLGSFGYSRPTSPFLDSFAREAISYKNHFSNSSQSPPGFFSLFSGIFPFERKDWSTTSGPYEFLPELFTKEGYFTVGFGAAPYISPFFGYDRGYEEFFYTGVYDETDPLKKATAKIVPSHFLPLLKKFIKQTKAGKALNRIRYFFLPQHAYADARVLNKKVESFLQTASPKSPLFLWIHYMDTHNPFLSTREQMKNVGGSVSQFRMRMLNRKHLQLTRFDPFEDLLHMKKNELRDLEWCYDAKIRYLDGKIKELVEALKKAGMDYSNTVFAITSDHGEAFGEHSGIGHTERLYDEVIHVPFFLRIPGEKSQEVEELTEHIDILPTLAKLGGISYKKDRLRGMDMVQIAHEGKGHEYVFAQVAPNVGGMLSKIDFARSVFAVRTKKWKFIKDYARGREELYDLLKDLEEERSLVGDSALASVEKKLKSVLEEHIQEMGVLTRDSSSRGSF